MATETPTRTRDHTVDDDTDKTGETTALPAMPDEQLEAAIQMDRIRQYTVRPGLLRLPVEELTTASNSPKYVLQLHHPTVPDEDIRFFIEKPVYWDPETFFWPRFLDWYGYTTRSQYQLQTDRVYASYDRESDEWTLTKPPSDTRRRTRRWRNALTNATPDWVTHPIHRTWRGLTMPIRRMRRALSPSGKAGLGLLVGSVAYAVFFSVLQTTSASTFGFAGNAVAAVCLALLVLAVYAVAVEPPSEDGRHD